MVNAAGGAGPSLSASKARLRLWIRMLRLSESGTRNFESMASAHESWVNEIFANLSPSEAEWLARQLKQTGVYPRTAP